MNLLRRIASMIAPSRTDRLFRTLHSAQSCCRGTLMLRLLIGFTRSTQHGPLGAAPGNLSPQTGRTLSKMEVSVPGGLCA